MDIQPQKRVKAVSSTTTFVPSSVMKQRAFNVQPDQASTDRHQQQKPDLQTQLDRASRFGHNFGRIQAKANRLGVIQPKLTIGQPGDKYEQEADRVADQVMAMPASTTQQQIQRQTEEEEVQAKSLSGSISPTIQLQTEEEDEQVQTKVDVLTPHIQRQETTEEDEQVQTKSLADTITPKVQLQAGEEEELQTKVDSTALLIQRQESTEEEQVQTRSLQLKPATPNTAGDVQSLESRLAMQKGSGSPLSNEVRAFMEPRFGVDFRQVKIHTGSEAVQMNRELNAQAFAHGRDIYFGAGKYNPSSDSGKRLLAHELTHVVQQTGGVRQISQSNESIQRWSLKKAWKKATKAVKATGSAIAKGVKSVGGSLKQAGKSAWSKIKQVGSALLDFVPGVKELKALLSRASSLIAPVLKNPGGFLSNLFKGVKAGFMGFVSKVGTYLDNGLKTWLFGALGNSVKLPSSFDLKGIFEMLLQMAGISHEKIRQRAVKNFGEDRVSFLEQGVEAAKGGRLQEFALGQAQGSVRGQAEAAIGKENTALVNQGVSAANRGHLGEYTGDRVAQKFDASKAGSFVEAMNVFSALKRGPAGILEYFKNLNVNNLKDMVLGQIKQYLMQQVMQKALLRITAYLAPGAGWALAVFDIIKVGKFFIERAQKIKQLIDAFFNSLHDAANKAIGSAAKKIEGALADSVPVLIDFLADYLGIGGLAKRVKGMISKASGFVNKHIVGNVDLVVSKIMSFLPELPSWASRGRR